MRLKDFLELQVDEKYWLSEKMVTYVFADTKERWEKVRFAIKIDEDLANTLTATMTKMHRSSIDTYISEEYATKGIKVKDYRGYRIRRLTPRECFRLQGWTDEYFDRARPFNSDSQLYKQAGNGVTVTVIEAIARRMK